MPPDEQPPEKYNPLALITVVLASLLLFSVFFLGFLVAPLAILTIFYVGFAASDRSKQRGGGGGDEPLEDELPPEAYDEQAYYYDESQLTAEERLAIEQAQRRAGTTG